MDAKETHTSAEAPCSWTVRYRTAEGFDAMLTLRGGSGADVLTRAAAALTWLSEHGAAPDAYGPAPTAAADLDHADDPAWCTVHDCAMARHEEGGQVRYSYKDDSGA